MHFSQTFINQVLAAHNLIDLVSQYTELKRRGSQYMGLCPLDGHNESSPSFSVSEDKQLYHCFGCGQSGNLLIFYQAMTGATFAEAVEQLAHKAGLPLPRGSRFVGVSKSHQKMWALNDFVAQFYATTFKQLKNTHPAHQYAQKRRLTGSLCDHFQIGYAPAYENPLTQALEKNNFSLSQALKLGVIKCRDENSQQPKWHECYDTYRDRLMFPIRTRHRQCVGFGGRRLEAADAATVKKPGPKYLNSCESEVFSKSNTLYGLYETSKFIRKARVSVVVEGYMDLLALFNHGITNVAATLGTALTAQHARQLVRLAKPTVLLFDGDEAGQLAAQRSLPILLAAGLQARAVFLPAQMDPDDYIQHHGVQSLLKKLREAPSLFNLILDKMLVGFQGHPDEVVQVLDALGPDLQQIKDSRLRELYVQELATRLRQKDEWVHRHLRSYRGHDFRKGRYREAYRGEANPYKNDRANDAMLGGGAALGERRFLSTTSMPKNAAFDSSASGSAASGSSASGGSAPDNLASEKQDEAACIETPLISLHAALPVELQLLNLVLQDVRHLHALPVEVLKQLQSPGVRQTIELAYQQIGHPIAEQSGVVEVASKHESDEKAIADDSAALIPAVGATAYPPHFLSQLASVVQPLSALGPVLNKELGKRPNMEQSKEGKGENQDPWGGLSKAHGPNQSPKQNDGPGVGGDESDYELQTRVLADCVRRVKVAHQERQIGRDILALKGALKGPALPPAEMEQKLKGIMQRLKNKHSKKQDKSPENRAN